MEPVTFTTNLITLQKIEPVEDPQLILIVGGVGLGINVIGLVMFGDVGHGHSHGGDGHGHGHGDETDGRNNHGNDHQDDDDKNRKQKKSVNNP